MNDSGQELHAVSLTEMQRYLLAKARSTNAQRAADTVYGSRDTVLRQTMLVLLAGAELAEHDSPPEATLHLLSGRVRLMTGSRSWELNGGDFIAIPPERHSVTAVEDSVFLLAVIRVTAEAIERTAA